MLGFLIAIVAGFFTPQIEVLVANPIVRMAEGNFPIEVSEKRLIGFMAALLIAAILAVILGSTPLLGVIIGAILGYFGKRLFAFGKLYLDSRRGS